MNKRVGRPDGGRTDARERILHAARTRFTASGYQATTLRSIAKDCQVDVALISYYFRSKSGLFSAAMELPINPANVLRAVLGDQSVDARKLLAGVIKVWEDPDAGTAMRAQAQRAMSNPNDRSALCQYLETELAPVLAHNLIGPGRERRARSALYVLAGAVLGHYVLGLNAAGGPQQLFEDLVKPLTAALAQPSTSRAAPIGATSTRT